MQGRSDTSLCLPGKEPRFTSIVLPDKLTSIGEAAFDQCHNLTGSLIIPEGVVDIQRARLSANVVRSRASLSLPASLRYAGNGEDGQGNINTDMGPEWNYAIGVFTDCGFTCELVIPDNVELIGCFAFRGCKGPLRQPACPRNLRSSAAVPSNGAPTSPDRLKYPRASRKSVRSPSGLRLRRQPPPARRHSL